MARLAEKTALAAWRGLGCRDGGRIDLRADADGIPQFMEVNPLAGLRPGHSDLPILCELAGMPYRELIAGIMRSALKRVRND
jgi:D-alanine-D-alanine ligase